MTQMFRTGCSISKTWNKQMIDPIAKCIRKLLMPPRPRSRRRPIDRLVARDHLLARELLGHAPPPRLAHAPPQLWIGQERVDRPRQRRRVAWWDHKTGLAVQIRVAGAGAELGADAGHTARQRLDLRKAQRLGAQVRRQHK